jgi:putative ABC transport system substrate-binding protein
MRWTSDSSGLLSRRAVLAASAVLVACRPVLAQLAGRNYLLGFVVQPARPRFAVLFDELRRRGFIEGNNLSVYPRGFGLAVDELEAAAVEVAKAGVDAIYCGGDDAGRAAQRATAQIPIVVTADDIMRSHLVSSLAHPGGNITGISILATELDGKRLQLLTEIVPGADTIAALVDPNTNGPDQVRALIEEARSRAIKLSIHYAAAVQQIVPAIEAARAADAQALDVLASAFFNANRDLIIEYTARTRMPAIYQFPEYCAEGALVAYGSRLSSLYRDAARLLVKVMTGTKPDQIPIEQPTKIELAVNLKTAHALGLTVPPSILARADEVIE